MTCMKEVPRQTETIELAVQVYPYLELLSGIFLFFTLVVYVLLPDLRKRNGILIMCFISVLMLKYFSLFTLQIWGDIMPDAPCIMNGNLVHFAMFAFLTS